MLWTETVKKSFALLAIALIAIVLHPALAFPCACENSMENAQGYNDCQGHEGSVEKTSCCLMRDGGVPSEFVAPPAELPRKVEPFSSKMHLWVEMALPLFAPDFSTNSTQSLFTNPPFIDRPFFQLNASYLI